ncbi:MAG: hypothetical protein A2Y33_07850 [Spirochaetes bacterium GWF1_51_8]|nr:MAG: hypothetical protein A2Y33_07850 [Spirochaetes bacterium GWF1_51_8]
MVIGLLTIQIDVPYFETIKERRNLIRSIKDKIRKKFNVSVAEIVEEDHFGQKTLIAVVAVSNETDYLNSVLANVYNLVERFHPDIIHSYKTDFVTYE